MEQQLTLRYGVSQIPLQRVAFPQLQIHFGLKEMGAPATVTLGSIKSGVGIAHQCLFIEPVIGTRGNADTKLEMQQLPANFKTPCQCGMNPIRDPRSSHGASAVCRDNREFVPTHASHESAFGSGLGGLARHLA